jgi:hypothetical protein
LTRCRVSNVRKASQAEGVSASTHSPTQTYTHSLSLTHTHTHTRTHLNATVKEAGKPLGAHAADGRCGRANEDHILLAVSGAGGRSACARVCHNKRKTPHNKSPLLGPQTPYELDKRDARSPCRGQRTRRSRRESHSRGGCPARVSVRSGRCFSTS